MNSTEEHLVKNVTYEDPLGPEVGKFVYPAIGGLMFLAILFNTTGILLMLKSRDLRKHSQNFIFMIISVTELLIDVFYLFQVFWKSEIQYVCGIAFFLYTMGRHNVITHLIYLCVERFCAVKPVLNNMFQRMIRIKCRLIFLAISLISSCVLFLPTVIMYANPVTHACGVIDIFGEKHGFVLGMNRTVFCVELLFVSVIYIYLVKKIKSLNNVIHVQTAPVAQSRTIPTTKDNASNPSSNNPPQTFSMTSKCSSVKDGQTCCDQTMTSSNKDSEYSYQSQTNSMPKGRWRLRAFKMLRCAILTTVVPSIPLFFIQLMTLIRPSLRSPLLDLFISLCNISHAIIYPLVFMVTVKQCKCKRQ